MNNFVQKENANSGRFRDRNIQKNAASLNRGGSGNFSTPQLEIKITKEKMGPKDYYRFILLEFLRLLKKASH